MPISIGTLTKALDAKNDGAVSFYKSFGFQRFPNRPERLFLLVSTAQEAFGASTTEA